MLQKRRYPAFRPDIAFLHTQKPHVRRMVLGYTIRAPVFTDTLTLKLGLLKTAAT